MHCDIIVTAITNPRARQVVARHLAQSPDISLVKATSMLETLPVTYQKNVDIQEAEHAVIQLQKIG
ncbi:MAG: hypothetical protein GF398_20895, partial [Chitinivibrionales bacterium]|nr:hypothetical protein [Chitinivibrionales bacterium]